MLHVPVQPVPWFAQKLHKKKIGLLAYQVPQSADCAKGVQATFDKYPSAKIEFVDTSLAFGVTDLSTDVSQMKDKGVDMVTTCMDNNGTLTLAKEMKKQGLNAVQYLPNAYNQKFIADNAPFFQGSYASTFFTPFEVKHEAQGSQGLPEVDEEGRLRAERELAGGLDQRRPIRTKASRRRARTSRARRSSTPSTRMKNYTANGLLAGIDWSDRPHGTIRRRGATSLSKIDNGKFVPSFGQPGKPFVCFQLNPLPDKLQSQPTLKG